MSNINNDNWLSKIIDFAEFGTNQAHVAIKRIEKDLPSVSTAQDAQNYGLVFGIAAAALIIWFGLKHNWLSRAFNVGRDRTAVNGALKLLTIALGVGAFYVVKNETTHFNGYEIESETRNSPSIRRQDGTTVGVVCKLTRYDGQSTDSSHSSQKSPKPPC